MSGQVSQQVVFAGSYAEYVVFTCVGSSKKILSLLLLLLTLVYLSSSVASSLVMYVSTAQF